MTSRRNNGFFIIPCFAAYRFIARSYDYIVSENTQGKVFGVFGEETVNVLKVNIEIAQRMGIL